MPPLLPGSRRGGKATGERRQLSSIEMFYFVLAFFFIFFFLKHPLFSNNKSYPEAKAFKRTGHGVCFPSRAGEAGQQLTAAINLQLCHRSIFICQRGTTLCWPSLPPPPDTQPYLCPGRQQDQSCNAIEGDHIFSEQKVLVNPTAHLWLHLPMRFQKYQVTFIIIFSPSVAISTSRCLLPRLLGLLLTFALPGASSLWWRLRLLFTFFNIVPQRCSIKAPLTALPCLLSGILVALPRRWRWSNSNAPSESRADAPRVATPPLYTFCPLVVSLPCLLLLPRRAGPRG